MIKKTKKQTNSVIDNSKYFRIQGSITHSLYLIGDPKTGKIKEECRIEKGINK